MSNAGKLVKDMLKAKKESVMGKLGDSPYEDPMEPWSAKHAQPVKEEILNEDGLLMKYIRSLGFNPEFMSFAQRSSYARSNAFKTYKTGHTFDVKKQNLKTEETEQLDEAGTGLLMSFIKSKGLNPLSMDGNQKKAYSRSSEFRIFKMRHVKETSGMGERGDDWNEASSPAQQAAIAIAMKKAGKKPKNVSEAKDEGEYDYEGAMAKTQLQTICRNAEELKNMLEDDENLPEWVQAKITKAEDYITTSLDYLKSTEELDEAAGAVDSLTKKLDKPKSYEAIDKMMQTISKESNMTPKELHNEFVKKHGKTPDDYASSMSESEEQIDELSTDLLGRYKKAAGVQASDADKAGDYSKGNKRFSGIMKATRKQFDNDAKKSVAEDLRKWFSKTNPEGDWKRINSKGDAVGPCAREPGEPKPKCMSKETRSELSKSERAAAVATKRKNDPVANRAGKGGKPVNVSNYGKGKLSEDEVDEACWDTHKKVGMKMKGGKMVPDCRPKNEEAEQIDEKNSPTNPALWSRAKSMARSKFDVYPSAYANGWASKWYKSKGGGWKSVSEDTVQEGIGGIEDSPMSATNSVKAMESEQRKKNMKSARIIKSIYKKKGKNESMYDWEKDDKPNAKITLQGGTTMTGKPRDTVEIEPVLKTRPNSQKQ